MTDRPDSHTGNTADLARQVHPVPVTLLSFLTALFFLNIVCRLMLGPLLPIVEREFDFRHGAAGSLYFLIAVGC